MFRGSFEHSLDQKGRVSVPSRFRDQILASGNPQIVLTRYIHDGSRCLDAYPIAAWERLESDFAANNRRFDRNAVIFENFYLGNALVCDIDPQGRVLIPTAQREWAGLNREVVFSGARDRFRIWDRHTWSKMQNEAETALLDPEFFSKLDL